MLPRNITLLVSIINTKLRDQYSSLEELCDDLDEDLAEILALLDEGGYRYNSELNQVKTK